MAATCWYVNFPESSMMAMSFGCLAALAKSGSKSMGIICYWLLVIGYLFIGALAAPKQVTNNQ
jgi:hypothetical protein